MGSSDDILDWEAPPNDIYTNRVSRKGYLLRWKNKVVRPAVWKYEDTWFKEQLARLNDEGLVPYHEIVPLRSPWRPNLQ